ncbi:MAG: hypothetical protein HY706_16225 [Candidatus Hydrogenedentes bacterium]|nr:hypothetical protein [Candidatus Hydrogenedentota bacterium]
MGLPNPFPDAFSTGPMFVWNVISTAFGFVASALLIAAGVGLFLLKPWARTLSIGYTIYAIASVVVGAVITWLVFIPEITKEIGAQTPAPMVPMMAVSMSFGTCAGLVYPILLLIFMLLPKVASAFKPPPPGPSA